jgi:hypothetical protein
MCDQRATKANQMRACPPPERASDSSILHHGHVAIRANRETGPALLLTNGLVMLGDFVAHVAATNGAGDCCQGAAVASAGTTPHQAADQGC